MSIPLKPRAEDYTPDELMNIEYGAYDGRAAFRVNDYLSGQSNNPLFMTAQKGRGKTLAVKVALRNEIIDNKKSFPIMSIHQSDTTRLLHPSLLANEEDWGADRYEKLASLENSEQALESANPLIIDDIHYRVESFVGDNDEKRKANLFVEQLKRYLEESKKGKKTVFISESPLNAYAEKLRIKALDDMLPDFGQIPYWYYQEDLDEYNRYKKEMNPSSFFEMLPPTEHMIDSFLTLYNIEAGDYVKEVLYSWVNKPRSIVKFGKVFDKEPYFRKMDMSDVAEEAKPLVNENIEFGDKNFYRYILNFPVLKPGVFYHGINLDFDYTSNDLGAAIDLLASKVDDYPDFLSIKLEKNPCNKETRERIIKDLGFNISYYTPSSHEELVKLYYMKEKSEKVAMPRKENEYFRKLLKGRNRYYKERYRRKSGTTLILDRPLEDIYSPIIYETSTSDIIDILMAN